MNTKLKNMFILVLFVSLVSCSDGYRIEGDKVIYERPWNVGHGTVIDVVDADPKTFELLGVNNMHWARDQNHVFAAGIKLKFLDPNSFVVLNNQFAKDEQTVVCGYKPIDTVDMETFKLKKFVNISGKKVTLGIDKNAAYECFDGSVTRMPSDSIEDFQLLSGNYYKDRDNVYWWDEKLELIDVNSFRILGEDYIVDNDSVYYLNRLIEGADPKTFKITGDFLAEDKNYKYEMEVRIE